MDEEDDLDFEPLLCRDFNYRITKGGTELLGTLKDSAQ